MMAYFEHKFLVCTSNVNSELYITNKTLLEWMEDIGSLHSDTANCGMKTIEETRFSWVIIQWKVKIYRRFRYGETITARTWISGTKRLYTFREYEFFDEKGELVAAASSKWVLTHLDKGMISVPQEIIDGYGLEGRTVFEEGNNMARLKDPMDFSMPYEFTVPCTFIDINDHMNNIFYLDLAYQAMPIEVFKANNFNEFEIMYRKECKLYDKLKCFYHFDGVEHVVCVWDESRKHQHAVIRLKTEAECK